ncbi:MAG TPA: hypothetical protein VGN16_25290 [Acidobacteriaceae bacterium]|jgi:hypothetical protein
MAVSAQGNHLTIQVNIGSETSSVVLSAPGVESLTLQSQLNQGRLSELRIRMRDQLQLFARLAESSFELRGSQRWEQVDAAMQCLRRLGSMFGSALFKYGDVPRVEQFCRDACRWTKKLGQPPRIELIVGNYALAPFEFIPFFQRKSPGKITKPEELEDEARSYPAFVGIIKRTIHSAPEPASRLAGRPELRAKVFQYAPLLAVTRVGPELEKCGVTLSPNFPQKVFLPRDFESRMMHIFRTSKEQIFYFGCHCDTTDMDAMNHHVTLMDTAESEERQLSLGTIDLDLYENGPRAPHGPLVFMNACGGADVMPSGLKSFPEVFLTGNFAGYIGTETIIPDTTAAAFATTFFKTFLRGETLGESMLTARRRLLDRGDPLGILYTAYASSDLLALRTQP